MATVLKQPSRAEEARAELDAYLALNQKKSLLRFLTCGSVDDGKSTLIGRLLYDSKMLFEELAKDEEHHIDFLETQLELVKQVGVQLYAQKHIGGLES